MLINLGVFFMFMSIIKLILQICQNSQKYLEKYDPTFIFVGSYFAERLSGKVRFFKGGNSVPQLSRIRDLLNGLDHDSYLLRDVRFRLSYQVFCMRFDLLFLFLCTCFGFCYLSCICNRLFVEKSS